MIWPFSWFFKSKKDPMSSNAIPRENEESVIVYPSINNEPGQILKYAGDFALISEKRKKPLDSEDSDDSDESIGSLSSVFNSDSSTPSTDSSSSWDSGSGEFSGGGASGDF